MTRVFRAIWLVTATSVRVGPWQSVVCLLEAVGKVLRVLQPLYLAWFVDGAVHHDLRRMTFAVTAFVVSLGADWTLQMLGTHARINQLERVGFEFDTQIAEMTARIPTLDHLESPRYLDELQALRDQQGALGSALNMLLNTVNNLVSIVGTVLLAATADWRLLLVAVAGVPGVIATRWTIRWQAAAENASAEPGRLATHLLGLGLAPVPGAELRVFGLEQTVRARLRQAVLAWRAPMVQLGNRTTVIDTMSAALFFGVACAALAWMVHDVIAGTVPVGAIVLAIMLVGRLQNTSEVLTFSIRNLTRLVRNTSRFLWLRDYDRQVHQQHPGTIAPPTRLRTGISLRHLGYGYPGADTPSLTDLTLNLPAGSVVALVGENGAGKSTLVKVLAGLYRPTEGEVLVDGTDLADLDLTAWRARMSGAFQDYARFEFLTQETVGVGDLRYIDDPTRVHRALQDGAAEDVLIALPDGLTSQLGTAWPDGVDLSGGQWQRLAIARGMMREEPLLLILDEPTAALDAATEHLLFERYAAAAREAGGRGAVTLLVTHRFSTVAAADLVVVLDRGRIIEKGTHHDLIAARGHYAELYELQARGYR